MCLWKAFCLCSMMLAESPYHASIPLLYRPCHHHAKNLVCQDRFVFYPFFMVRQPLNDNVKATNAQFKEHLSSKRSKNVILAEWFTFTFNHWWFIDWFTFNHSGDSQNDSHSEARASSQLNQMENAAYWSIFPQIWGTNYYVTQQHVVYLTLTSSHTKNKHFESWCFRKQFSASVF